MTLTHNQLLELHAKAEKNLKIKIARIPARAFASGRKPTIRDLYERPDTLFNRQINPHCQLDFVFSAHNEFAASAFRARKNQQDAQVTAAIFYWQMDQEHSLSAAHLAMRCNILLAFIIFMKPGAQQELEPGLYKFLELFTISWMVNGLHQEHDGAATQEMFVDLWKNSPYDFMRWSSWGLKYFGKAIGKLRVKLPACPYTPRQFWEKLVAQPDEAYKKHGTMWMMQYIVLMQQENVEAIAAARAEAMEESLETGGFADNFAGFGVEDGPPTDLSEALFEHELVKALLVDVDEDVVKLDKEYNTQWMDPQKALNLIEGAEVDEIIEMMTSSLLTF